MNSKKASSSMNDKYKVKPIIKPPLELSGISLEYASKGDKVQIAQKGSITSFDSGFNTIADNMCNTFSISPGWNILVRSNEDQTLIFRDNLPMMMNIRSKKGVKKGQLIYQNDIADITSLSFEDHFNDINPLKKEKVICIISVGYAHGIYFDFTGELDPNNFKTDIGLLFKQLKFPHIYNSLNDGTVLEMVEEGWFPFVEILGKESVQLTAMIKEQKADKISTWCEETFNQERVKKITQRWEKYSAYQAKRKQFEEGVECFYEKKYTASISTLNPLVEGVFNQYLLNKTGKGIPYKGDKIAESIYKEALGRLGENSLLFPEAFKDYLLKYFFKHTTASVVDDVTRNASSHGRSKDEAFTFEKAILVILTLDQIFFFMDRTS